MHEEAGSEQLSALERLERQNERLRSELKDLSLALDIEKNRQKHAKVPLLSELSQDRTSVTVHAKIAKLKQEINRMKKELEGNLNIGKITDLENRSAFLSKRIEELESEHLSLKKIEKEQQKALNSANNHNIYPEKIAKLKEEIREAKEKYRELAGKQKQDEKIHNAQHEKCVDLDEKCRKLFELIKKKKFEDEEQKKNVPEKEITESDISRLEAKIKEAENAKNEEEMQAKKRIKELETQVREGKHHLEMLKIKVKEKDQECRLSVLKIKELKKAMKHNQLRPLQRDIGNSSYKRETSSNMKEREENFEDYQENYEEQDKSSEIPQIHNRKKSESIEEIEENHVPEEKIRESPESNSPEPAKIKFSKPNFNF